MKIAVSVPDDVLPGLAEYVARHAPDRVTGAMDLALAEIAEPADQFVRTASRRVLERSDW
jgi:hypothetical protein